MINTPAFKKCFRVETVPSEGAVLLSEFGNYFLPGRVNELVAPMIDSKRTCDVIARELADHAPPEHVYYTLIDLERKGFIVDSSLPSSTVGDSVWSYLGVPPSAVRERLGTAKVEALATPDLDARPLAEALASCGLNVHAGRDLTVVLTSDYLRPELAEINRDALQRGKPWMLINPLAATALIGPIFKPGETGCWECLAQRIRSHRDLEIYLEAKGKKGPFPVDPSPFAATMPAIIGLGAFQAAKFIAFGSNSHLEGKVITLDLPNMVTLTHHLVKRPQCPACGDGKLLARPRPVRLERRPKLFKVDGGHRATSPIETFARYQHHVSPVAGVVSELMPVQNPSGGLVSIYLAGHNFAMQTDSLVVLRDHLRSKSCGKGMSDAQARTSALCEALERYSGLFTGEQARRIGSFNELGGAAIHPNDCMNFSARQYATRAEWSKLGSPFHVVPARFDPAARIEWTPVWSLRTESFRYLPTSYCYYGYPSDPETTCCFADSNGCAAGNTLEEAILQGFLELVERDAVAVWWYNRLRRRAVDLDSFHEPYIDALRAFYAASGRELWVLDVTSDFMIPTFVAISRRIDQPAEEIILGFGAHLDARIGVLRALTEMNQFLPAVNGVVSSGIRQYAYPDPAAIRWWQTATIQNQPYLVPEPVAPVQAGGFPEVKNDDILDDVRLCVDRAERLGMETLVLDQTLPDVDLKVVKVIVPGMRHFWARFGPGRLYDVPVKMGWLPRPLPEEQLNPVLMFI